MNSSTCQDLKFIDERQAVEDKYFQDITCCGERIATLHKLMEHHDRFHDLADFRESDEDEEGFPSTIRYEDVFLPVNSHSGSIKSKARESSLRFFTGTQECTSIDTDLLLQPGNNLKMPCSIKPMFDYVQKKPNGPLPLFDFVQKNPNSRPIVVQIQEEPSFEDRDTDSKKQYSCHEPHCNKVYKNLNGLRYHQKHGHHNGQEIPRPHVCTLCGKSYKASNGLRYHIEHMHTII